MAVIVAEMNLGVYRNSAGRWRWRLWNGFRLTAISAQSFRDRIDAELAALYFRATGHRALYETVAAEESWYWHAFDDSGARVAMAARPFDTPFNAEHAATFVSNRVGLATFW